MLRQLVRRLRKKIEPNPAAPVFIRTVPSLGYQLVGDQPAS
jgi:DNA-binding response OmpR family regulator